MAAGSASFVLWARRTSPYPRAGRTLRADGSSADDIRSKAEIENRSRSSRKKPELELEGQVSKSLVGEWKPEGLRERVPARLKAIARGEARPGRHRAGRSQAPRGAGDRSDGGSCAASGADVQARQGAGARKRTASKKTKSRLGGGFVHVALRRAKSA